MSSRPIVGEAATTVITRLTRNSTSHELGISRRSPPIACAWSTTRQWLTTDRRREPVAVGDQSLPRKYHEVVTDVEESPDGSTNAFFRVDRVNVGGAQSRPSIGRRETSMSRSSRACRVGKYR